MIHLVKNTLKTIVLLIIIIVPFIFLMMNMDYIQKSINENLQKSVIKIIQMSARHLIQIFLIEAEKQKISVNMSLAVLMGSIMV